MVDAVCVRPEKEPFFSEDNHSNNLVKILCVVKKYPILCQQNKEYSVLKAKGETATVQTTKPYISNSNI